MGISASQARLLSITARLTTNEYESQQVSNAKMRLAIESQQASADYLAALNTNQLMFTMYDAKGNAINTALTANVLYQYADMKNQYVLSNAAGQVLLLSEDYKNFESSNNLDEFLAKYGITKEFKTATLAENYNKLHSPEYKAIYDQWEAMVMEAKNAEYEGKEYTKELREKTDDDGNLILDENGDPILEKVRDKYGKDGKVSSEEAYMYESFGAYLDYAYAKSVYEKAYAKSLADENNSSPGFVDNKTIYEPFIEAQKYLEDCSTYENWLKSVANKTASLTYLDENNEWTLLDTDGMTDEDIEDFLKNKTVFADQVEEYYDILNEFTREAEDLGFTTLEQTYSYSDEDKAKWYTNLWYRLNGESSIKDPNAKNYALLDSKLASSEEWIKDSLKHGIITIESSSNQNIENIIQNEISSLDETLQLKLRGITWTSKVQSSCKDITQTDNQNAIAKAEAEYERKTQEISVKDLKYQNKIKLFDTEHSALEKQYESVKSALDKNIGRSFKTFNS